MVLMVFVLRFYFDDGMHPGVDTALVIVRAFAEFFYMDPAQRMKNGGDIRLPLSKRRKSKRLVEGIHTAPPKGFFPLFRFGTLCKRMVSPASVRDAHPVIRVNHNIGSV